MVERQWSGAGSGVSGARWLWPAVVVVGCATSDERVDSSDAFILHTRARRAVAARDADSSRAEPSFEVVEETVRWDPRKTAVVIVDMWNDHWCSGAAARVAELAGPVNDFVSRARSRGALIVHAPSTTVAPYEGTPARRRASEAPPSDPPVALSTSERWGTAWCWPDSNREPDLPIDDSDMGCDCEVPCEIRDAWSRQIDGIEIRDEDAITDSGAELWNLFAARGIENVIILGVHLNMCVLGRPFGIRQLVRLGRNVLLVRDLTDTMYNSRKRPFVDHFTGTDLVVEHVEKYWCPSIESTDLRGGGAFRFRGDPRGRTADVR